MESLESGEEREREKPGSTVSDGVIRGLGNT